MNRFLRRSVYVLLAVAAILGVWLLVDQASWRLRVRPSEYFTALGALSTALTAVFSAIGTVGVLVYVVLTYKLWREAQRTNQQAQRSTEATLMSQLMIEYDNLRDSIRILQEFYKPYPTKEQAVAAFQAAKVAPDQNSQIMTQVDPSRFRVSRFFVHVRKLANTEYLSTDLIKAALDRAAMQDVFLELVDPLDEAINRVRGRAHDAEDREFFQRLVDELGAHSP